MSLRNKFVQILVFKVQIFSDKVSKVNFLFFSSQNWSYLVKSCQNFGFKGEKKVKIWNFRWKCFNFDVKKMIALMISIGVENRRISVHYHEWISFYSSNWTELNSSPSPSPSWSWTKRRKKKEKRKEKKRRKKKRKEKKKKKKSWWTQKDGETKLGKRRFTDDCKEKGGKKKSKLGTIGRRKSFRPTAAVTNRLCPNFWFDLI